MCGQSSGIILYQRQGSMVYHGKVSVHKSEQKKVTYKCMRHPGPSCHLPGMQVQGSLSACHVLASKRIEPLCGSNTEAKVQRESRTCPDTHSKVSEPDPGACVCTRAHTHKHTLSPASVGKVLANFDHAGTERAQGKSCTPAMCGSDMEAGEEEGGLSMEQLPVRLQCLGTVAHYPNFVIGTPPS